MNLRDHELRDCREVYGHDGRAINRHSVRQYAVPGHDPHIYLDKTLDGCPPFYELYDFEGKSPCLATSIPVNGQRYFGDGLTWREAECVAGEAIQAWFDEVNEPDAVKG